MAKYDKQYNYSRRKTALYQNAVFHSYGHEYGFFHSNIALNKSIRDLNDRDGEKIHVKHAILMLLIKLYATETGAIAITDKEVFEYYNRHKEFLPMFFDHYASNHETFQGLFHDLIKMNFLNPYAGGRVAPTTRLAKFCNHYNRHCNELMPMPDAIAEAIKKFKQDKP